MNQQPGSGSMRFDNAFNGSHQNAVGDGARVHIGPSETIDQRNKAQFAASDISANHAFNNTSLNAVGSEAQVNVAPDMLKPGGVPDWVARRSAWTPQAARSPVSATHGTPKVVISYSPEDRDWLEKLRTHLGLLERQHMIALWDNTQIGIGKRPIQAVAEALNAAHFAVLLVSASFLASDFIAQHELSHILQRLSRGQLTILPILLSPCMFQESSLGQYDPFNLNRPLSTLSPPEQDKVFVCVARTILLASL